MVIPEKIHTPTLNLKSQYSIFRRPTQVQSSHFLDIWVLKYAPPLNTHCSIYTWCKRLFSVVIPLQVASFPEIFFMGEGIDLFWNNYVSKFKAIIL